MKISAITCIALFISAFNQTFAQAVGHTTITFSDATRTGGFGSSGNPGRQIQSEIYYPAASAGTDVAISAGEYPVIMMGHGFVIAWDAYQNIWDELVPNGYIMVFPRTEGGFSPSHDEFSQDLALLVNEMGLQNVDATSIFHQALNGKAAIMGHSMGGGSAILASNSNLTIETVVGLAPAETTPSAIDVAKGILVPSMILSGSADGVTPAVDHHIPIYDSISSICKYFIDITGGAHCYFANSNFNCDFGEGTASSGISITRTEQHAILFDYLNPWFDFYLKGICSAKTDFDNLVATDSRVVVDAQCTYTPPAIPVLSLTGTTLSSTPANTYEWYLDGLLLPGETGQSIILAADGDYIVITTDANGCTTESLPFTYTTNTANIVNEEMTVGVYPNPFSSYLNIDTSSPVEFQIFSILGELVAKGKLQESGQIDLSDLNSGTYILELTSNNKNLHKSIIKR